MKLDALQTGRAVAAIMVVLFHAHVFTVPDSIYRGTIDGVWRGFGMGFAGVEFFFVLSGFIMFFVHRGDIGVPVRAGRFIRKRLIRIYPIYWIILGGLVCMYFAFPGRGPENARDPLALVTSFLLIPTAGDPIMRVAWTLEYEMFFYLMFTLMILGGRLGLAVFAIWMTLSAIGTVWPFETHPLSFVFSYYNLLFLFGIGAAALFPRLTPQQAWAALAVGVAGFLLVGLTDVYRVVGWAHSWRTVAFGLFAALAVAGLAAGVLRPWRWTVFLGDASYSIYLAHLPAMGFAALAIRKAGLPGLLPVPAVFLVTVCCGVLAGVIIHLLIEKPVLRLLSQRARPHPHVTAE
ncbi:acyltransferase family protein [Actibacterium ureilyticum]|uniref:acyltransferase family protein n=1 Tax=Actibacterium ureilyticum TaxID=1590614 RepID=UPI000BAAB9D5|nr:acyltransferase [Actibacterium ureilyticum]